MNSIKNKINVDKIDSIKEIQKYVVDRIKYVSDRKQHGKLDWWQWPNESLSLNIADCEDHAILMIAMAYQFMNAKCNMLILKKYKDGRLVYHAVVEYDGTYYNSTGKNIIDLTKSDWSFVRRIPFWWLDWEIRLRRLLAKICKK